VLFASVPVTDPTRARAWYEQLFGRPADIIPNDSEEMWRIADGAWLYVIADPERAGRTVITLCVPDLDEATTSLEGRGILVGSHEAVGTAGRKAWLSDPDGNAVALIEVRQAGDA